MVSTNFLKTFSPKKYCKNIPSLDRIGFYSFALNPLEVEPSGTCNFSKINNKNIKIAFANNNLNKHKFSITLEFE